MYKRQVDTVSSGPMRLDSGPVQLIDWISESDVKLISDDAEKQSRLLELVSTISGTNVSETKSITNSEVQ